MRLPKNPSLTENSGSGKWLKLLNKTSAVSVMFWKWGRRGSHSVSEPENDIDTRIICSISICIWRTIKARSFAAQVVLLWRARHSSTCVWSRWTLFAGVSYINPCDRLVVCGSNDTGSLNIKAQHWTDTSMVAFNSSSVYTEISTRLLWISSRR